MASTMIFFNDSIQNINDIIKLLTFRSAYSVGLLYTKADFFFDFRSEFFFVEVVIWSNIGEMNQVSMAAKVNKAKRL